MTKKGQRTRAQRRHETAVLVNHLTVCGFYPVLGSIVSGVGTQVVRGIAQHGGQAFYTLPGGAVHMAMAPAERPGEKWPDLHVLKFLARKAGVWQ